LRTPARVRTRPEAAPINQTEERLREKVNVALSGGHTQRKEIRAWERELVRERGRGKRGERDVLEQQIRNSNFLNSISEDSEPFNGEEDYGVGGEDDRGHVREGGDGVEAEALEEHLD
jgi:hypothetical protein